MKSYLVGFLLILATMQLAHAEYNESFAIELAHLAGAAYCDAFSLMSLDCGYQCEYMNQTGWKPVYGNEYASMLVTVSHSFFYHEERRIFVVAFRGTNSNLQLLQEMIEAAGVPFSLHPKLKHAYVLRYFYTRYKDLLRGPLFEQLQQARKVFSNYTLIFTGHSLGGALATLSIVDAVYAGQVQNGSATVYTFGSPRVGDIDFVRLFHSVVQESHRITHYRDLVVHIPTCVTIPFTGRCAKESHHDEMWFPYHVNTEVFYGDEAMTLGQQKICKEEDPSCANQFLIPHVEDHLFYFGFHVTCTARLETPENADIKTIAEELSFWSLVYAYYYEHLFHCLYI